MIRRVVLAAATAAAIAGGALAAPTAYASTSAGISQPSCYSRTVKCLAATPATPPPFKYQPQAQPPVHYHA
jgi:uncharacterized membrane protein